MTKNLELRMLMPIGRVIDMAKWSDLNMKGAWYYRTASDPSSSEVYWYTFEFEFEEDRMLFNLTWG